MKSYGIMERFIKSYVFLEKPRFDVVESTVLQKEIHLRQGCENREKQKTHITHSRTVCHCMLLKKQQCPIFGIRCYKLKFTYNHYVLRYYEVGASSVHQGLSCVVLQAARPAAQASQRLASEEPVSCCGQDLLSKYREGSHWFPGRDGKFRNLQMNAHKFRHYYTLLHLRNDVMHLQGSHLLSLSPFIPPKWQLKTRNFYE